MPQDAITLAKTANELNAILQGAKINKINHPVQDELLFNLYSKNQTYRLRFCINAVGARVGFTDIERKNPSTPSGFCMLLRKHLLSATIKSINTIQDERIIRIAFDGKNDFLEPIEKQLYCEIMGKYSNLIFCENEIILGTMKTSALEIGKERALLCGVKYALPKSQGKISIYNREESLKTLSNFNGGDLAEYLFNCFQGFSIATSREVVFRFFNCYLFENSLEKTGDFYEFVLDFINQTSDRPIVIKSLDKFVDFCFCDYKSISGEKIFFDSLLDAEKYFFDSKQTVREFNDIKNKLN